MSLVILPTPFLPTIGGFGEQTVKSHNGHVTWQEYERSKNTNNQTYAITAETAETEEGRQREVDFMKRGYACN